MVASGDFAWIDGGNRMTSTCHVLNLVHAIELAIDHGVGGRAYFVADDGERSIREFLTALLATRGVDPGKRSFPGALVRVVASVLDRTWRVLGKTNAPPVTRFAANMMSATVTVDTRRIREELGYEPVIDVETGLAQMSE